MPSTLIVWRLAALVAAVTGLVILLQSQDIALGIANSWLQRQGGADTQTYLSVLQSYGELYRLLGAVLLAVGLFHGLRPAASQP
jgi:hypothetical protein